MRDLRTYFRTESGVAKAVDGGNRGDDDDVDVHRRDAGLFQRLLRVFELFEDAESAHPVGQRIAGEVGDTWIELPQPVCGRVVTHQSGPHDRTVRIDDPFPRCTLGNLVRHRVGDLETGSVRTEYRRAASNTASS